jgi:hypothetical protein
VLRSEIVSEAETTEEMLEQILGGNACYSEIPKLQIALP